MLKAMLSQPMAGKADEEIKNTREKAIQALKERGYEIVNTLFTDEWYSQENMEACEIQSRPLPSGRQIDCRRITAGPSA